MHVQVDRDPVAVGERIGVGATLASLPDQLRVHGVELRRDRLEALRLGVCPPVGAERVPTVVVGHEIRHLLGEADRCARCLGLQRESLLSTGCGHEDRRFAEGSCALVGPPDRADVRAISERTRNRGTVREWLRVQQVQLPAVEVTQEPDERTGHRPPRDLELGRDDRSLPVRSEDGRVDSEREQPVIALEALRGGGERLLRRGEERVDPDSQSVASRSPRWIAEALGREERRGRQSIGGRGEREVREARKAGLDAVDDVVASPLQREREIRPDADGDSEVRSARDRDRRADRDHVWRLRASALERPAPGEQVTRSRRGSQHRHLVSDPAERGSCAFDVRVDLVRLRPREGRDEADPETHGRASVALSLPRDLLARRQAGGHASATVAA